MSPALVAAILFIIAIDFAIAGTLIAYAVRSCWSPIAEKFPARDPSDDAVRRDFQSFAAGLLKLGWSIHVAADADHLHLTPTLFARLLRIAPASIPWAAITPDPSDTRRHTRRATIAGHDLEGPRWCIELANPGSPP